MDTNETLVEEVAPVAPEPAKADVEVAPVEAVKVEGEETPKEGEQETPEQIEAKKAGKFQRRLDRQKAARVAAETEARLLREELARVKATPATASSDAIPDPNNFANDADYHRAVGRWEASQEARGREAQQAQERAQMERAQPQRQAYATMEESWTKREADFTKTTADYEAKVTPFLDDLQHFADATRQAVVESDMGPALLYHLATNPEEAERIADLSPARQMAELGKLEERLSSRRARSASNAPTPPNPTRGGASAQKDPSKMSVAEFAAWRAQNGSNWIRRA